MATSNEDLEARVVVLEKLVGELMSHQHYRTPNNSHLTSRPCGMASKVKHSPVTDEKTS